MSILDRVAELRAAGREVISLCAGEPSGGAPRAVRALAATPEASGLGYTSALGLRPVREAIARSEERRVGREGSSRGEAKRGTTNTERHSDRRAARNARK